MGPALSPPSRKPTAPRKIYTKTGDAGRTGLFGAPRVPKSHPRIEAYGEADELNAVLGVARAHADDPELARILARLQEMLFVLGADLASPKPHPRTPRIAEADTRTLEQWIDAFDAEIPPLDRFILPGGSVLAAWLHLGRTVCRRMERRLVAFAARETVNPALIPFTNRLSDLLFTMARVANKRAKTSDIAWVPEAGKP